VQLILLVPRTQGVDSMTDCRTIAAAGAWPSCYPRAPFPIPTTTADTTIPAVKQQPGTRPCSDTLRPMHPRASSAAPQAVRLPAPATMPAAHPRDVPATRAAATHPRDCVQGVDGLADAALAQ
jgi:hypothetical protein